MVWPIGLASPKYFLAVVAVNTTEYGSFSAPRVPLMSCKSSDSITSASAEKAFSSKKFSSFTTTLLGLKDCSLTIDCTSGKLAGISLTQGRSVLAQ